MNTKRYSASKSRGWNFLTNTPKEHWFEDGMSLCGRWMLLSAIEEYREDVTELNRCKACQRKLDKLKAKDVSYCSVNVELAAMKEERE